jgi:hypothetical protein
MDPSVLDIINGGGVLGFAVLVYFELRTLRKLLAHLVERVIILEERTPPFGARVLPRHLRHPRDTDTDASSEQSR